MILIYVSPTDKLKIQTTISILKEKLSVFFINDDDFIFSTETNQKSLREIILTNKVILFYTYSLKKMGISSTEISELIIFLLKNNCVFQSELDNLYLIDMKMRHFSST